VTYHLSRNGQPTGTCSKEDAIARYARGEILPTDLVWCEGMPNWAAASEVFGAATPQPTPTPTPAPTPSPSPTPVAPPQHFPRPVDDGAKPSNYLVFAILATLFCCLPFGIVAIIFAAQVDTKWQKGDRDGALLAAKNAKTWCWVAFGVGLAFNLIGGAIYFVMVMQAVAVGGTY